MKSLTVLDIVRKYLDDTEMDGLVNEDAECACFRDDLEPCGQMGSSCVAGKIGPCTCGNGCDEHIVRVSE